MKDKSCIAWILGLLLFAFIVFLPLLHSGYTNDDSMNSFLKGTLIEQNITIVGFIFLYIKSWILTTGRFFPLSTLNFLVFMFTNLFEYKFIVISTIIIDVFLFALLIKNLTGSRALSLFSILILPILFQIRLTHDPILGYYIIPMVTLYTIISLNFFVMFFINKKFYFYLLSLLFFTISLLSYEATYPFFILFFILSLSYFIKESNTMGALKIAFPFLAITVLCGSISLILLRFVMGLGANNTRYGIDLSSNVYPAALIEQISAAFPLIYYIVDPQNLFHYTTKNLANIISINSFFIFIIYVILFVYVSKSFLTEISSNNKRHINTRVLLFLGLSFLVLPGIIVSMVPTYQKYIICWGSGYLPVFISYFGVMFLLIYFIILILSRIRLNKFNIYIILFFAISIAFIGTINYNNNLSVIDQSNEYWLYPRSIIEEGARDGLFSQASNNSTLIIDNADSYPWDQKAFYIMISGVEFKHVLSASHPATTNLVSEIQNILPRTSQSRYVHKFSEKDNIYYLNYSAKSDNEGYAILSPRINDLIISNETILEVTSSYAYIYIKSPNIGSENLARYIEIHGYLINSTDSSIKPFIVEKGDLDLLSHGKDWILFRLHKKDSLVELRSLYIGILQKKGNDQITFNKSTFLLSNAKDEIFHVGFENGLPGKGIVFNPIHLNDSFTIMLNLKPAVTQVPYAAIIGNHPGKGYEGFVIQQNSVNRNEYIFGFGNGKEWLPNIKFNLTENRLDHLLIDVRKNQTSIYVDGKFIGSVNTIESIKNSNMPLYVGNWVNGDRPFNGVIDEIKITNR